MPLPTPSALGLTPESDDVCFAVDGGFLKTPDYEADAWVGSGDTSVFPGAVMPRVDGVYLSGSSGCELLTPANDAAPQTPSTPPADVTPPESEGGQTDAPTASAEETPAAEAETGEASEDGTESAPANARGRKRNRNR